MNNTPDRIIHDAASITRTALEQTKIGTWRLLDPDTAWWSPEMFDLHGLPRDSRLPSPQEIFRLYHPDDTNIVGRQWKALFTSDAFIQSRYRIVRSDGEVRHLMTLARRVPEGEDGQCWVYGTCLDVTDVLDDPGLFERERSLRFLAENMRDMVVRVSDTLEVTFASRASRILLGLEPEDLLGHRAIELIHPEDLEPVRVAYRARIRAAQTVSSVGIEYRARHRDGHYVWLESNPRLVLNGAGQLTGYVDVIRDVTERRLAQKAMARAQQEAERAALAKSEFLANMSHELRTPLTSIIGFSRLIDTGGVLPESERRFLNLVRSASETLLAVVNDILDFSRLEAGAVELCPVDFVSLDLAEEVAAVLEQQATMKGVALSVAGERGVSLCGDATRLRQVLLNLVGNAVKFTASGQVLVEVSTLGTDDPDRRTLQVRVSDTGIGIPPDRLSAIFERFSQVDGSISRQFGGTGLGLAISQRLIQQMDGQIGVESDGSTGSTFWFSVVLPMAAAAATAAAAVARGPDRALKILLAEDHPANVVLVQALLSPFDIDLTVAPDGLQALNLVREQSFDLILMDMQMPVMDGPAAARAIRGLSGAKGRIPIVALTANVIKAQIDTCLASGMQGHVAKPINPDALFEAIETWTRTEDLAPAPHMLVELPEAV